MNREDQDRARREDQNLVAAVVVVGLLFLAGLLHWLHQPGTIPAVWP